MSELLDRLRAALGATYRLETELGGGGMSRVFLATETELDRKVVIKVLPPDMAAGVNKERFQREIKLAASLQHPHVVPLLTAGTAAEDLLYYVMPFIDGESLRAKLTRHGELPVGETVQILKEVMDALAYAHEHGVVHRDIKPDNVLLSGDHALVTDFGVAKAVSASSGSSSLTSLGVALGTPAYMSPEQAAADPLVDHRADIYAVGALAYEMLTGQPPFTGATPQQVLAAQVSQIPEPVTSKRDTIPAPLAHLVMRCLAKRAADRWQTAAEVKTTLAGMVTPSGGMTPTATLPVDAVSISAAERALRSAHPVRVAALFGAAAAGVLVVVYVLMIALGLPDWVFVAAIALLAVGLPIMLVTGKHERQRAAAVTTGLHVTTPVGMEKHSTWRKSILGGGMAFAALAFGTGGYMFMRTAGVGPFGTLVSTGVLDEEARIVLADFEARTTDTTLGGTVADLFRIGLSESPTINLLSAEQVAQNLELMSLPVDTKLTAEVASRVAAREGVRAYLTGDIRSLGEGFLISARLVGAESGEEFVSVGEQADNSAGIVAAVDRMSTKIRERIGESFSSLRNIPPLARFTTSSIEALRLYRQASQTFDQGNSDQAISLMEQAVRLDTSFAMGWRRLGAWMVTYRTGQPQATRAAIHRAYDLRDRLTEQERYHVEGLYHGWVTDSFQNAETAYLALLEKYPSDGTALNNLAAVYFRHDNLLEAERWYRETIARRVAGRLAYNSLTNVQWSLGRYAAADTTVSRYLEQLPNHPDALLRRIVMPAALGDYDSAQVATDAFLALHGSSPERESTAYRIRSDIAAAEGRLGDANRWDRERLLVNSEKRDLLTNAERPLAEARNAAMTAIWYGVNQPTEAELWDLWMRERHLADEGRRTQDLQWIDYVEAFAQLKATERARSLFGEFQRTEAWTATNPIRRMTLEAELALAEGRSHAAVETLRTARDESTSKVADRVIAWLLARAYEADGVPDSAIAYYRTYIESPDLFAIFRDRSFLPPALLQLGTLYETTGDRERAVEYYDRFVNLWEDADAELQPQVQDVRERIARLVGERR